MTTPHERAKAELKRKLIDALISEKVKTDKVVALLKTSPQYQEYLVQAASQHLDYFKSQGGDTRAARDAATSTARLEADELLTGPSIGALKERAQESMTTLTDFANGLDTQIDKAERAIAAMDTISEYEFVKDITSSGIISITWKRSRVDSSISDLKKRKRQIADLRNELNTTLGIDDEKKLREALRKFREKIESTRKTIGSSSITASDALTSTSATIDEKALEALIRQKVARGEVDDIKKAADWAQRFNSLTGAALEKTSVTGTITKAIRLLITGTGEGATRAVVSERGDEYSKTHTRGQVYSEHDSDPLLLATNLVERQNVAIDLLMQSFDVTLSGAMIATMGPGEIVMQAWAPISKAITIIVKSRLKARLKLAQDAIAAKNAEQALAYETDEAHELESEIKDKVWEVVAEKAGEFAKEAGKAFVGGGDGGEEKTSLLDSIKESPGDFTATVLGWIMPPLMVEVWKIFPPKPAQAVSGDDLTQMQNVLFQASAPLTMAIGGTPTPRQPVTEIDDKPDRVPQAIWDKFVATNAGRSSGVNLYVALEVAQFDNATVWGTFDTTTRQFTPDRLDDAALDDWDGRTVAGNGYSDGALRNAQPAVRGTWSIVRVGQYRFVLLTERGGATHWGAYMANTRGPRGVASTLGAIVSGLPNTDRTMEAFTVTA